MNRHHTGSGRRKAVTDDWADHHRVATDGGFNGTVTVTGPLPGTSHWDDPTQQNVADPGPTLYAGPATVEALSGQGRTVVLAEDAEILVDYQVAIPADADVDGAQLVKVTDGHGDVLLEQQLLRVRQIVMGTERFERVLLCQLMT